MSYGGAPFIGKTSYVPVLVPRSERRKDRTGRCTVIENGAPSARTRMSFFAATMFTHTTPRSRSSSSSSSGSNIMSSGSEDEAPPTPPIDGNVDEDLLRVLVSTDNHLGYCEREPVRGLDSFAAFEEVLHLARKNKVFLRQESFLSDRAPLFLIPNIPLFISVPRSVTWC